MQRRYRLRRSKDFERLRRKGQRWRHPLVILIVRANGLQMSRFGFSASRRVGKAIIRNRSKRLLRESVRNRLDLLSAGWDCLFIARPASAEATYAEMDEAVLHLMKMSNVLAEK